MVKVPGVFRSGDATRSVADGAVIFEEGADGGEMYGIVAGAVELRTARGVIAQLGPDDVFGEMAIIDSSPRMATAVAVGETELAVIDRRHFLFLVHETPMFALQVMSALADRLRTQPAAPPPG
jgi:CRP/FNR family transcriptional regulator, cyclic AMP receptor protein